MTPQTEAPPRIHFLAVYRAPHELAGLAVERGRECGCGRWFSQHVVSPRYLAALSAGCSKAFVEGGCEVEQYAKGTAAWFPKKCHRCERRRLDASHPSIS